jgi:hypothetical protein
MAVTWGMPPTFIRAEGHGVDGVENVDGGDTMARPQGERRADYFLYAWQIRAIRRLAAARGETPSQVARMLLTAALTETGAGGEEGRPRNALPL